MRTWITSDTHFNHTNICGPKLSRWASGYRNFDSLADMNDQIIDNINSVVMPNDTLFHLGDWGFGNPSYFWGFRNRIRCKNIHFIIGNHDEYILDDGNLQSMFSTIKTYDEIRHNGAKVVLFHFPIASWHKIGKGSVHCFGHCHGSFTEDLGRAIDVGVDTNDMRPYNLDDVVDRLMAKPLISGRDHHL